MAPGSQHINDGLASPSAQPGTASASPKSDPLPPRYYPIFAEANSRRSCCSSLLQAAKLSHSECVQCYLRSERGHAELFRRQHARVPKPLQEAAGALAAANGEGLPACTACVNLLLAEGADVRWVDEMGRTPLERAAGIGCVPCIRVILRWQNTKLDRFYDNLPSALIEAVKCKSVEGVLAILSGGPLASANKPAEDSLSAALTSAVQADAQCCFKPLLDAGATLNSSTPCRQASLPLFLAASHKHKKENHDEESYERGLRLLVNLGADVNAVGPRGQTALHGSAAAGLCNRMQILLDFGANPTATNERGETPLHLAVLGGHAPACQLLTEHMEEPSPILLGKDQGGETLLLKAVAAPAYMCGPRKAECLSKLLDLIEASGESQAVVSAVTERNKQGRTAVHVTAMRGETDCLAVFVRKSKALHAAMAILDKDGLSPSALAMQAGLDLGDVLSLTRDPWTPCCARISQAAREGHTACLRYIISDCALNSDDQGPLAAGTNSSGASTAGKSAKLPSELLRKEEREDPLALVPHDLHDGFHACSTITRLLLEAGFDPEGCRVESSPLHRATQDICDICLPCAGLLIDAGAKNLFETGSSSEECPMYSILHAAAYDQDLLPLVEAAIAACGGFEGDHAGVTGLFSWASMYCNVELLQILSAAGAGVNEQEQDGRTPLHAAAGLFEFEDYDQEDEGGDASSLEWLISKGAIVDARDGQGNTPLHYGASVGFKNAVAKLLDAGADPLTRDQEGKTVLHKVANADVICTASAARLIDLGVGVNARCSKGFTPLHVASEGGHVDFVRMLLDEGANKNVTANDGSTPLRCAARALDVGVLKLFLESGANLRESHFIHGNLLHSAAHKGRVETMKLLVEQGLRIDSKIGATGESVIHMAVQNGGGQAVKWLLGHGASLHDMDIEGRQPSTSAFIKGKCDWRVNNALLEISKSEGGDRSLGAVFLGRSLIHYACGYGMRLCVETLLQKGALADARTSDDDEETALHCAARFNHPEVMQILVKAGASVDMTDERGKTPLHDAAINGFLEAVDKLLDLGASVNVGDDDEASPLHLAAKHGHLACVSLLVARGADMSSVDSAGRNALGVTLERVVGDGGGSRAEREAVMKLLIELGSPVGRAEVCAASRGALAKPFAVALTSRMSDGLSARKLIGGHPFMLSTIELTSPMPLKSEGASVCGGITMGSQVGVTLSRRPSPRFSSRRRFLQSREYTSDETGGNRKRKIYLFDCTRLQQLVSHLEGPDEVDQCFLLKVLLPPPAGWAGSFKSPTAEGPSAAARHQGISLTPRPSIASTVTISDDSVTTTSSTDSGSPNVRASARLDVELSFNGDDFDEVGFEAVIEYLSTGHVEGATNGSIHKVTPDGPGDSLQAVGKHAIATHRAAGFFGLPRLQGMVRIWLEANGAEMEDNGTTVLSRATVPSATTSEVGDRKRKFEGKQEKKSGGVLRTPPS